MKRGWNSQLWEREAMRLLGPAAALPARTKNAKCYAAVLAFAEDWLWLSMNPALSSTEQQLTILLLLAQVTKRPRPATPLPATPAIQWNVTLLADDVLY